MLDTNGCNEITTEQTTIVSKLVQMQSMKESVAEKQSQIEPIKVYIEQVQNYLKQCGVAVESCPKCGEAVIFDIDKLGA
jgi:L-lactate utilization protein LutB